MSQRLYFLTFLQTFCAFLETLSTDSPPPSGPWVNHAPQAWIYTDPHPNISCVKDSLSIIVLAIPLNHGIPLSPFLER